MAPFLGSKTGPHFLGFCLPQVRQILAQKMSKPQCITTISQRTRSGPPKCSKSDQLWYTKKEPDLPKQAPKQANQSGTKPGACTVQIWHPNASKFGSTSGPWLLFSMKLLRSCCSSFRCMVDALAHFEMGIIRCCIQGLMLMMARSTNI